MPPDSTDGGLSSRAARPRRRVPRDCDALERDRAREALVELGLGVVDSGKTDLVTVSTADLESGRARSLEGIERMRGGEWAGRMTGFRIPGAAVSSSR
jgi:hypothetical protein